MHIHLIFDKRTENNPGKKEGFFKHAVGQLDSSRQRQETRLPYFTHIKSKWIKELSLHTDTIKLLEENAGNTVQDVGLGRLRRKNH